MKEPTRKLIYEVFLSLKFYDYVSWINLSNLLFHGQSRILFLRRVCKGWTRLFCVGAEVQALENRAGDRQLGEAGPCCLWPPLHLQPGDHRVPRSNFPDSALQFSPPSAPEPLAKGQESSRSVES